jgi:dihydroneopterin aldolase
VTTTSDKPDLLKLQGLRVSAFHGVFEHERRNGQVFVIDVEVRLDLSIAASGDDLASTIHYGELAEEIVESVERDPVDLIETLAERVARVVLGHDRALSVVVTVHKPDAPITVPFADVSVTIERFRS